MKSRRHLSWENFLRSIYIPGEQRMHRVSSSPEIEIFADAAKQEIGLWIEADTRTIIPEQAKRLTAIIVDLVVTKGKTFLKIATSLPDLHRQFYLFATAVADRILLEQRRPEEAIVLEIDSFEVLLAEKSFLSIERQIGLLGELLVLERLLLKSGPSAIDAWIGPRGEPHDFRIVDHEFEVKTSLGTRRIHTINGLTQLKPSSGCILFVISILLGSAGKGAGFTLPEKIQSLADKLQVDSRCAKDFNDSLGDCGYKAVDREHYSKRFDLRNAIKIISIQKGFPAITSEMVEGAMGSDASRIEYVRYDLNFEGLGNEEGTKDFEQALYLRNS